jgi:cell division protein FtsB
MTISRVYFVGRLLDQATQDLGKTQAKIANKAAEIETLKESVRVEERKAERFTEGGQPFSQ